MLGPKGSSYIITLSVVKGSSWKRDQKDFTSQGMGGGEHYEMLASGYGIVTHHKRMAVVAASQALDIHKSHGGMMRGMSKSWGGIREGMVSMITTHSMHVFTKARTEGKC